MAASSGTRPQVNRLPLENIRRQDPAQDAVGSGRLPTPKEERVTPRRSPRGEMQSVTPDRSTRKADASEDFQPSASGQPPASVNSARSWATISPIKPPTITSSRLSTPRSLDGSCNSTMTQGRRGKLQRLSEKDALSSPATSERHPSSLLDEGQGRTALISSAIPPIQMPRIDNLLPGLNEACSFRGNFSNELLWDDSFLIATDCYSKSLYRGCGSVLIIVAILCLYIAAMQHDAGIEADLLRFALLIISCVMLFLSMALFLRFGAPVSLRLLRVEGNWSISLHRRGLSPKTRHLTDFEAFVETFGYFSKVDFWGKRLGFATSKAGTVHLIFSESSRGPTMAFTASIQHALPFFVKLGDILAATAHPLTEIVQEYIADWQSDTSMDQSALA